MDSKLVGISFAIKNNSFYIPLKHNQCPVEQLDINLVLEKLTPIFTDENILKIGQNIKYDMHILENYGITINNIADTMLLSYCLNSTKTRHNLDDLAKIYLGHKTITYKSIAKEGNTLLPFEKIEWQQALPYALEDVEVTKELYDYLYTSLTKIPTSYDL